MVTTLLALGAGVTFDEIFGLRTNFVCEICWLCDNYATGRAVVKPAPELEITDDPINSKINNKLIK